MAGSWQDCEHGRRDRLSTAHQRARVAPRRCVARSFNPLLSVSMLATTIQRNFGHPVQATKRAHLRRRARSSRARPSSSSASGRGYQVGLPRGRPCAFFAKEETRRKHVRKSCLTHSSLNMRMLTSVGVRGEDVRRRPWSTVDEGVPVGTRHGGG